MGMIIFFAILFVLNIILGTNFYLEGKYGWLCISIVAGILTGLESLSNLLYYVTRRNT